MKFAVPLSTLVVGVIAILVVGLFVGFGFIQGKTNGTTEYLTQTQTSFSTQIIVQTVSLTTTEKSVSTLAYTVSNISTLVVPTTLSLPITNYRNVTRLENQTTTLTIIKTINQTKSMEPSGSVILLSDYRINFTAFERDLAVTQASFTPGFNGYLEISYESTQMIHWVLYGNSVNETSIPQATGGVEFPVMSGVRYSLYIYNDGCNFGCIGAFNVTTSVVFEY